MCQSKEAAQQLRGELKLGSLKELREGEKVREAEGQLGSLQQDREVEEAEEGVSAPAAEHTAGR